MRKQTQILLSVGIVLMMAGVALVFLSTTTIWVVSCGCSGQVADHPVGLQVPPLFNLGIVTMGGALVALVLPPVVQWREITRDGTGGKITH